MTVPVPLADIEAAAREAPPGPWGNSSHNVWTADSTLVATGWSQSRADAAYIAAADPPTVLALCEALRIAVEGLDLIAADETGCCYEWWDTTCAKRGDPEPCHFCIVNERRAAVRELVDLGGNDGP